ncbi:FecR family protein [Desertivirga xinjiangensis]|uniref:FecR family protein n=1 Tax=Desertivirga xinjiangensis TaxID=539206 RepID=UPI00210C5A6D|nr:FecR domain-containing protein [Pedobacter xinjiangensis]
MADDNRIWLLISKKLSGTLTSPEGDELDSLFKSHPDAWYTFEVLSAIGPGEQVPEHLLEEIRAMLNTVPTDADTVTENTYELPDQKKKQRFNYKLPVFAALIALVMAGGLYFLLKGSRGITSLNKIYAGKGKSTEVTLPDGSRVKLNSGSYLTYPSDFSSSNTREVNLEGEAFFIVDHDEERPFIIHTRDLDIKDLGTTFNVRSYPAENITETALIEGAVEVVIKGNPATKRISLKPAEKLIYYHEAKAGQKKFEVMDMDPGSGTNDFSEIAWISDKLIFKAERLEDLAGKLERRYDVAISIHDESLKNSRITGAFAQETLTEAMDELKQMIPFNYWISGNRVLITPK